MTPYKDPEKQRAFSKHWATTIRREWMQKQECCLCGRKTQLRVFKHAGAPRITWNSRGPSHSQYRVACADASACLRWRNAKWMFSKDLPTKPKTQPHPSGVAVPEPAPALSKIAKELTKPDKRLVCPVHGHRNTTILRHVGLPRFVCCGRVAE